MPYILELDHELTVIAEYANTTDINHVADGRRQERAESPERRRARIMAKWCTKAVEDNPLPGTDDFREQYFLELRKLTEAYAADSKSCPGCKVGQLMRRWRAKLEAGGHLLNV